MKIKSFSEFINEAHYNDKRAFGDRPEYSASALDHDYPSPPDYNYRTTDPLTMDMDDMMGDIYRFTLDKNKFADEYKQWVEDEPKGGRLRRHSEEENSGRWEIPHQITIEELKANFEKLKKFWNLNIEFPVNVKEFYDNMKSIVKRYEEGDFELDISFDSDDSPDLTKDEVEKYWRIANAKHTKTSKKFGL